MGNINERRLREGGEPRTPAEQEYKRLMGKEGDELFSHAFPSGNIDEEIKKAAEYEDWFTENAADTFKELAVIEMTAQSEKRGEPPRPGGRGFPFMLKPDLQLPLVFLFLVFNVMQNFLFVETD